MKFFSVDVVKSAHFHETEKEAQEAAEKHVQECKGVDGYEYDEEDIQNICWGEVNERAVIYVPEEDTWNVVLTPIVGGEAPNNFQALTLRTIAQLGSKHVNRDDRVVSLSYRGYVIEFSWLKRMWPLRWNTICWEAYIYPGEEIGGMCVGSSPERFLYVSNTARVIRVACDAIDAHLEKQEEVQ